MLSLIKVKCPDCGQEDCPWAMPTIWLDFLMDEADEHELRLILYYLSWNEYITVVIGVLKSMDLFDKEVEWTYD